MTAPSLAFTGRADLIATYAERMSERHAAWRRYDAKALDEAMVRMARLERVLAEDSFQSTVTGHEPRE